MATRRIFSVDREREKIIRLYQDLREVLEATLKDMKNADEGLSAAKVDVAVRAMKALPSLLLEVEKLKEKTEKRKKREAEIEDTMANLPSTTDPTAFAETEPKLKLPFPLRKGGA